MDEQPSPRVLDAVWRNRWTSLAIVLAVVLVSAAVSYLTSGSATATVRIVLMAPDRAGLIGVEPGSEAAFVRYLNQRALFVTSDVVLEGAKEDLSGISIEDLRRDVSARTSESQESIVIEAVAETEDDAEEIARAVVLSYRAVALAEVETRADGARETISERRREIEQSVPDNAGGGARAQANAQAAAQSLSELDGQATQLRVAQAQIGDGVAFVDGPKLNGATGMPTFARDGAIGLGLGLVLAAGIAWVREDRDRQIRDPAVLAGAADEPLLGEIERFHRKSIHRLRDLTMQPTKSYRLALAGLRQAVHGGLIVVTGTPGSGVTTTAFQLANAAARGGLRVLLVDAAVRSQTLTTDLGFEPYSGLTDLAAELSQLSDVTRPINLGFGVELAVLPSGATGGGASNLFREGPLHDLLDQMRSGYDVVVMDASPPSHTPETARLIQAADAVVITVRHGTRSSELIQLHRQLTIVGGTITGYVLTFVPRPTRHNVGRDTE